VRKKRALSLDSTLTLLSEIAPLFPSPSAQFGARKTAPARARGAVVVRAAKMSVKDLKPTGNRVLVIADPAETTTAGGILLASAETAKGPGSSVTGKVASVGAEVKAVKAGDKVLINGFSGSDVEFADGEMGKFITVDDVIAIIS
jgi:chaperonin GroES